MRLEALRALQFGSKCTIKVCVGRCSAALYCVTAITTEKARENEMFIGREGAAISLFGYHCDRIVLF